VATGVPQFEQNRASGARGCPQTWHSTGSSIGSGPDPTAGAGLRPDTPMGDSGAMEPTTFRTPGAFRRWLERHHAGETELWVGFYRKATGKPSMTWSQAVDEALCFGWIDGKTKRIDEERFTIRFTPRRRGSVWSARNVGRVEVLLREGRMRPAGISAFEARREDRSGYSSREERHRAVLPPAYERRFRTQPDAWAWFRAKAPSYRQAAILWVLTAKKEETRERRLRRLIESSAAETPIPPLARPPRSA
jgi:uncharacterized protein YdeI (YjbR/CyaY-like superfamily)